MQISITSVYSMVLAAVTLGCGQATPAFQERQPATQPEEHRTAIRRAGEFLRQGKYRESIKSAEKAIALKPDQYGSHVQIGTCYFMLAEMPQAIQWYDSAIEREPRLPPQLWQRGLALYYAGRFEEGKQQFETHQTYNTQDVENAVWHMLCHAKLAGVETARKSLIPISGDSRVPMKEVYLLFAGKASVEDVIEAAQSAPVSGPSQRDQYLYYAYLYCGLFAEMQGNDAQANSLMEKAVKVNPIPKGYLMGSVAQVHLQLRAKPTAKGKGDSALKEPGKKKPAKTATNSEQDKGKQDKDKQEKSESADKSHD